MLINKIKYIISDLFGIDEFIMYENTSFIDDLEFDSLDMFTFRRELEERFMIKLPEVYYIYTHCRTIEELAVYIESIINEKKEVKKKFKKKRG